MSASLFSVFTLEVYVVIYILVVVVKEWLKKRKKEKDW